MDTVHIQSCLQRHTVSLTAGGKAGGEVGFMPAKTPQGVSLPGGEIPWTVSGSAYQTDTEGEGSPLGLEGYFLPEVQGFQLVPSLPHFSLDQGKHIPFIIPGKSQKEYRFNDLTKKEASHV